MRQIIWIAGSSSSGKKTFIEALSTDKQLQQKLGIDGKNIAVLERSMTHPGDTTMPEIVQERELIPRDAGELLKSGADVVLIKWQYIDSAYNLPEKLKAGVFNAESKIILLEANKSDSIARLTEKDWWHSKGFNNATELYDYEKQLINTYVEELRKSFSVITLDSSDGNDYVQK